MPAAREALDSLDAKKPNQFTASPLKQIRRFLNIRALPAYPCLLNKPLTIKQGNSIEDPSMHQIAATLKMCMHVGVNSQTACAQRGRKTENEMASLASQQKVKCLISSSWTFHKVWNVSSILCMHIE